MAVIRDIAQKLDCICHNCEHSTHNEFPEDEDGMAILRNIFFLRNSLVIEEARRKTIMPCYGLLKNWHYRTGRV